MTTAVVVALLGALSASVVVANAMAGSLTTEVKLHDLIAAVRAVGLKARAAAIP
ncbi:MAG: hypothetical protein HY216_04455 [Candidatus Rokubacteria bacterium]|nr:hypothetical protein [Candidatus Rokubacteria bacterium]